MHGTAIESKVSGYRERTDTGHIIDTGSAESNSISNSVNFQTSASIASVKGHSPVHFHWPHSWTGSSRCCRYSAGVRPA